MNVKEIVVGNSLPAVVYAAVHELPLIYADDHSPLFFEYFNSSADLSFLTESDELSQKLKRPSESRKVGPNKKDMHKYLSGFLSVEGLMPLGGDISSIHLKDESIFLINTGNTHSSIEIDFERAYVFCPEDISGIGIACSVLEKDKYIYDFFKVRREGCILSQYDVIEEIIDDEDIMSVWPSNTGRVPNREYRDVVCISKGEPVDVSDIKNRFVVRDLLTELTDLDERKVRVDPWVRVTHSQFQYGESSNLMGSLDFMHDLSCDCVDGQIQFESSISRRLYNPEVIRYV